MFNFNILSNMSVKTDNSLNNSVLINKQNNTSDLLQISKINTLYKNQ